MTVSTRPPESVLTQLLYSTCVPILTYGAAIKDLSAGEKHRKQCCKDQYLNFVIGRAFVNCASSFILILLKSC